MVRLGERSTDRLLAFLQVNHLQLPLQESPTQLIPFSLPLFPPPKHSPLETPPVCCQHPRMKPTTFQ